MTAPTHCLASNGVAWQSLTGVRGSFIASWQLQVTFAMSTLVAQPGGHRASNRGTILLASPNACACGGVAEVLRRAGYTVDIASDKTDWNEISLATLQAAILIASNQNWLESACSAIRGRALQLVLLVLGPNNLTMRIKLFDMGADAYLVEPFAPAELLARITSLIRTRGRLSCSQGTLISQRSAEL